MTSSDTELLKESIARNLGALLSLPSAGMLRHHKSRFLAEVDGGILIECPSDNALLINELIANQNPCGVAFKKDHVKCIFASPIRSFHTQWEINAETKVDAALLEFPTEIKAIQRRSNYRVKVGAENSMSVRVWRVGERAYLGDQPMAAQEVKAQIRDLSVGGVGVIFLGKDGKPPQVTPDDRLRVLLNLGDDTMLIEGRMRAAAQNPPGDKVLTGIQFKKLENDLKGRQMLAQITRAVGELQREEVRRVRMGLMQKSA